MRQVLSKVRAFVEDEIRSVAKAWNVGELMRTMNHINRRLSRLGTRESIPLCDGGTFAIGTTWQIGVLVLVIL
jgi:hypothetical protein